MQPDTKSAVKLKTLMKSDHFRFHRASTEMQCFEWNFSVHVKISYQLNANPSSITFFQSISECIELLIKTGYVVLIVIL